MLSNLRWKLGRLRVFTDHQVISLRIERHSSLIILNIPAGTGKTHTLIELIRQLTCVTPTNPKPLRVLVCGASNLSVDNILERLLALPAPANGEKLKVTRVGHPARVMAHEGVLDATLEMKASRSDQVRTSKILPDDRLLSLSA